MVENKPIKVRLNRFNAQTLKYEEEVRLLQDPYFCITTLKGMGLPQDINIAGNVILSVWHYSDGSLGIFYKREEPSESAPAR